MLAEYYYLNVPSDSVDAAIVVTSLLCSHCWSSCCRASLSCAISEAQCSLYPPFSCLSLLAVSEAWHAWLCWSHCCRAPVPCADSILPPGSITLTMSATAYVSCSSDVSNAHASCFSLSLSLRLLQRPPSLLLFPTLAEVFHTLSSGVRSLPWLGAQGAWLL